MNEECILADKELEEQLLLQQLLEQNRKAIKNEVQEQTKVSEITIFLENPSDLSFLLELSLPYECA